MASPILPNGVDPFAAADAQSYATTPKAGLKRKRGSLKGPQSPDSDSRQSVDNNHHDSLHNDQHARQSTTKRACNECRQQKLRCDIVTEPDHIDCSRCRRLKLECRIDANFKRIGKRSRNAAMEREIQELRAQLEGRGGVLPFAAAAPQTASPAQPKGPMTVAEMLAQQPDPLTALHQGAVGSLIDLKNSGSFTGGSRDRPIRVLGNTQLQSTVVDDLFRRFFEHYHPHIPMLDTSKSPDYFFDCSPLLFWSIIAVASRRYIEDPTLLTGISAPLSTLLWTTIAQVPQNYHVVKALCLLCTWPLPTKSTSTDPTFILSGIMMQIALQTGLHRPSHVQDFSRIRVDVRDDDVNDRLRTWAACNIVVQAVSTGTGQPPKTIYDHTLTHILEPGDKLPPELFWRLRIERFCNKVSQKLYNNRDHPIGISSDTERAAWISLLVGEYRRLGREISQRDNQVEKLYLAAAGLHLRLSAFFDSPSAPNYANDLLELYFATTNFLNTALDLTYRAPTTPSGGADTNHSHGDAAHNGQSAFSPTAARPPSVASASSAGNITSLAALKHVSYYIMQMLLAGGFTLMKLLNSFFAQHIDAEAARKLFNNTIRAIRAISVSNNDLPGRLAEVLAQLWRSSGAGVRPPAAHASINGSGLSNGLGDQASGNMPADNSLQLKVRCRMSMSLLFDSVWRWREEFVYKGGADNSSTALANLEKAVDNPIDPEAISGASSNAGGDSGTQSRAPSNLHSTSLLGLQPPAQQNSLDATLVNGLSDPADPSSLVFGGSALDGVSGVGDLNYEVFDPLTWMLDGDLGDYGLEDGLSAGGGLRDPWS